MTRDNDIAMAVCGAALLAALAGPALAKVDSYLAVQGGAQWWGATSNSDELEAGSEAGWNAGLAGGVRLQNEDIGARLELELAHRANNVHGINPGGEHGWSADHLDGNVLHATSLMANVWPEVRLSDRFSLYAGGGFGGARLSALDDDAIVPAWQVGGGVTARLTDRIDLDIGYRRFSAFSTDLAGLEAEYEVHGPVVRFSFALPELAW